MAEFALREHRTSEVMVYLASKFYFSGTSKTEPSPAKYLAEQLPVKERTVYNHLNWLINRNWIGKDYHSGWYHFRGLNTIHQNEGWKFSRAVRMKPKDLFNIKPFLMGAFIASLVKTWKRGKETERNSRRSEQLYYPVSYSAIAKILKMDRSTVKRIIKHSQKLGFLKMEENLIKVKNLSISDVNKAKQLDLPVLRVDLIGSSDDKVVPLDRFRFKNNEVFIQEPNLIYPLLEFKSRRGLSKYR